MSTSTAWMPEVTGHALPSVKTVWEISSWNGRFLGRTDDPQHAEQMAKSGYVVKEA